MNLNGQVEGPAISFLSIRKVLGPLAKHGKVKEKSKTLCPHCQTTLKAIDYEGVEIQYCETCGGKLAGALAVERIVTRKEAGFSQEMLKKVEQFKEEYLFNPYQGKGKRLPTQSSFPCPHCGCGMLPRPFSYQYFIPIDRCLGCAHIWFDADELEILHVLIEQKKNQ